MGNLLPCLGVETGDFLLSTASFTGDGELEVLETEGSGEEFRSWEEEMVDPKDELAGDDKE